MLTKIPQITSRRGFSLIELSIVLVIIGILISASLKLVGPISQIVKMRETKEILDSTVQSIISWTSSRNTLPNKDEFAKIAKSPNDSWGQPLAFLYYSSLSRSMATKDTICGRRTTPLMLYTNYTSSSVAFAVVSRADNPDLTFKSLLNGGAITASAPVPAGMINAGGINADIVRWVTLDELRSKIGCQGSALKIINLSLPTVTVGYSDPVSITADGGVPFNSGTPYQWCISPVVSNVDFTPTLTTQATCSPTGDTGWVAGNKLSIKTGVSPGTYTFTANVRDNDGNVVQRTFNFLVQAP